MKLQTTFPVMYTLKWIFFSRAIAMEKNCCTSRNAIINLYCFIILTPVSTAAPCHYQPSVLLFENATEGISAYWWVANIVDHESCGTTNVWILENELTGKSTETLIPEKYRKGHVHQRTDFSRRDLQTVHKQRICMEWQGWQHYTGSKPQPQ